MKLIYERDKYLDKKKCKPDDLGLDRLYKLFRNRVTREIKKAKRKYYKEYFENNLNNMKKTWQGIKEIINMNRKSNSFISHLTNNGKQIDSNDEIATTFNNFFTNIGRELDKEIPI